MAADGDVVDPMSPLRIDEVTFHPHSFADPHARLFTWKGKVYRAISADRANFYRALFDSHVIRGAVERGLLVESEPTSLGLDGYELVIRHRRIRFQSYPNEWCAAMLRDGALTLVDLATELTERGYTLGDAHPWNLLFDLETMKPVFVDLGSVAPITDFTWPLYDEFVRFCLYPLALMARGEDRLARLLMCEDGGVAPSDMRKLHGLSAAYMATRCRDGLNRAERAFARGVPESSRLWLRSAVRFFRAAPPEGGAGGGAGAPPQRGRWKLHRRFLEGVRRDVERIKLPQTPSSEESASGGGAMASTPQPHWTAAQRVWHSLLAELRPGSLLDVGSNSVWHAKVAALQGIPVVRWDAEPARVGQYYSEAKESNLPLLPLVMDFSKPTPARGLANHWSVGAAERLRCDMVLALGMLRRVVGERRLNFDQIADGLASLAVRWVVVEFCAGEGKEPGMPPPSWYTPDNFVRAARSRFREVRPILEEAGSRWLLCQK